MAARSKLCVGAYAVTESNVLLGSGGGHAAFLSLVQGAVGIAPEWHGVALHAL
jgi:hypothetical protein